MATDTALISGLAAAVYAAVSKTANAILQSYNPCADHAVCSARPSLSTMLGLTGLSCVSVTASVFTTASVSSVCRFGCTAPYVPLQFVASGDTMVTGGCWNTKVPTACSTYVITPTDKPADTMVTSTCSTPAAGVTFTTATPAQQSCAFGEKLAVLGGPNTCRAMCPDGFTATTSATIAFCTATPTSSTTSSPSPPPTTTIISFVSGGSGGPPPLKLLSIPSPTPPPLTTSISSKTSLTTRKVLIKANSGPAQCVRSWRVLVVWLLCTVPIASL